MDIVSKIKKKIIPQKAGPLKFNFSFIVCELSLFLLYIALEIR